VTPGDGINFDFNFKGSNFGDAPKSMDRSTWQMVRDAFTGGSPTPAPLTRFRATLGEIETLAVEWFSVRGEKLTHVGSGLNNYKFINALRGCASMSFHGEHALNAEPILVKPILNEVEHFLGVPKGFGRRVYEDAKLGKATHLDHSWADVALRLKPGQWDVTAVQLLSTTFWPSKVMTNSYVARFEEHSDRSKGGYLLGVEGWNSKKERVALALSADLMNTSSLDFGETPFMVIDKPAQDGNAELLVVHLPTYLTLRVVGAFIRVEALSQLVWMSAPSKRGYVQVPCRFFFYLDFDGHHASVKLEPASGHEHDELAAQFCTIDEAIDDISSFDLLAFKKD
jgi:hypothetical protein